MTFNLAFPADSNTVTGTGLTAGDMVTFSQDVTVTALMAYIAGWVSPRIYDGSTHALVGGGPMVKPTDATVLTRMPLASPVTLTAGHPYLICYWRDTSSPNTLVKKCTSVTSVTASGVTMALSGSTGFYYGAGGDFYPTNFSGGSLLSLGVEAATVSTGVTATAAQTLPALTQSAAGTVTAPPVTATAAQTLPAITQTATGTYSFTITVTPDSPNALIVWPAQPGATSYWIERDGAVIANSITGTSYTDTPGDGTFTYEVGVLL